MRFIMNKEVIQQITEKANQVLEKVNYNGIGLVSTDKIVSAVSQLTNTSITYSDVSFSKIDVPGAMDIGAMMCVIKASGKRKQTASILINSDKDIKFRRFSLIHELGHLINNSYTTASSNNEFTLSTHIRYDVTSFTDEACRKDPVLESEQKANIFALRVLMPTEALINQIQSKDSFFQIADFFGVSEDAVRSRMLLGL